MNEQPCYDNLMIITGLITEYNPFHRGHLYHIEQAKRLTNCDLLIIVMSAHFMQRGEPAIVDKWKRTQAALEHGIDLVIELPYIASTQDATHFAQSAVSLLNMAGCTHLVFGSESNDLAFLQSVADLPINVDHLKEQMKTGMSYPKAYNLLHGPFHPNDILAIAYLKAIHKTNILPLSIQRTNAYHSDEITEEIASATAIRKALLNHAPLHQQSMMEDVLLNSEYNSLRLFYPFLRLKLLTLPKELLKELFLMHEGLENHLKKMAVQYDDFNAFIDVCVNRRYTKARIQRTLIHLLTHTTKKEVNELPELHTLRILGMNEKGRAYIKQFDCENVVIASRFNQINEKYRLMELRATRAYASTLSKDEAKRLVQRELEGPIIV